MEDDDLLIGNRALLFRFRGGERAALDEVFRHYAAIVTAFLRSGFMYSINGQPTRFSGLRSAFDLEETLQDVFERAFTAQARYAYDGVRAYRGFVLGIARNVVLDRLRKQARRGEVIEPVDAIEARAFAQGAVETAPEVVLDERRGRELVAEFIDNECDDRDRTLYRLRYVEDLSQEACGHEIHLSRIQVRRWEKKFRARLLRYLKRANYVRDE